MLIKSGQAEPVHAWQPYSHQTEQRLGERPITLYLPELKEELSQQLVYTREWDERTAVPFSVPEAVSWELLKII
jgi:hypothetical protein